MAEIKKMTKKDYFDMLREIAVSMERQDLVDFIDHEKELLVRKSSRTAPTKTQVENEAIKEKIVATLIELDRYATNTESQNANTEIADLTNQKISTLLKQLVDNKVIEKVIDKKKAHFKASV